MKNTQLSANSKNMNKFHATQGLKTFASLLFVAGMGGIGYWTHQSYQNLINPKPASINGQQIVNSSTDNPYQDTGPIIVDVTNEGPVDSSTANNPISPSTPSQPPGSGSSLPDEIHTVINALEGQGVKNNQHVTADTSYMPNGTTIIIDRSSWVQQNSFYGSLTGTITMNGKTSNSTVTMQNLAGTWKVTEFSIYQ